MEKIILLGSNKSEDLAKRLSALLIMMPELHANRQSEVCDFVTNNLSEKYKALAIDVDNIPPEIALIIAMYVRLSPQELKDNSLAPIFFLSSRTMKGIIKIKGLSQILQTPHVHFESIDRKNLRHIIEEAPAIREDKYKTDFLDYISIQLGAKIGRHSLANQWGASVLSKILSGKEDTPYPELIEASKNLYFRYITSKTENNSKNSIKSESIILEEAKDKKILLIDDEAGKGWKNVLQQHFTKAKQFDTIQEAVSCFDDFSSESKDKIEKGDYDLIFLDLRLNGIIEDNVYEPESFSGMRVLRKIKSLNKGTQVIMLTASNKAWNLKALLDAGADGYYIKESPEYQFSQDFSYHNFKALEETIIKCLKKSGLRYFFLKIKKIKQLIKEGNYFRERNDEILMNLDVAFDLLNESYSKPSYLSYTYLQLFLILEEYTKQDSVIDETDSEVYIYNGNQRYRILKDKQKGKGGKYTYKSVMSFNGHYSLKKGELTVNVREINFRMSSLLIFKFGCETSGQHDWTSIYNTRNEVAHQPKKGSVSEEDLDSILDFLIFFFDENNVSWRDVKDAFPDRTEDENRAMLEEKFGKISRIK